MHGNLDQAQRENKLEEQGRLRDKLKATLETSEESLIAKFALMGDDRRALALDPPLLMWDRREAEPLLARDDEFYSPRKLALLDFRPIAPRPWSMDQEQTILYDYLLTHMYYSGIQTLKSLDHLAPGAFEAVAPHIPELKDPLKGGRYDIEEVRARTLTPELLYKVTLAWQRWHFRPSIQELLSLHEPEALGPEESIDNP